MQSCIVFLFFFPKKLMQAIAQTLTSCSWGLEILIQWGVSVPAPVQHTSFVVTRFFEKNDCVHYLLKPRAHLLHVLLTVPLRIKSKEWTGQGLKWNSKGHHRHWEEHLSQNSRKRALLATFYCTCKTLSCWIQNFCNT